MMETAIKRIDSIIERKGECLIGGSVMEQYLGCGTDELLNELKRLDYVIRESSHLRNGGGYVVYPRRKKRNDPWLIIQVV